ncbi:hypothetical protein CEV31_3426 [Brucella thiophenivorans]|uniref:Uncharacterized protein n=1 Tax=Brucella thiophenivorans TaxID=571255 RepID=A0A256FET6_9HYPH|nr:hypothetical protein CEV31_3426 [Brucella thiophenivorans]
MRPFSPHKLCDARQAFTEFSFSDCAFKPFEKRVNDFAIERARNVLKIMETVPLITRRLK